MSKSSSDFNKQSLSIFPDTIIDLYEIDFSNLQSSLEFLQDIYSVKTTDSTVYRFCPMINGSNPVVWQGESYQPLPIKMENFEYEGEGRLPRPKLSIANPDGLLSKIVYSNQDFVNCKVTRKRTFARFLDQENFDITPRGLNEFSENAFGQSDPGAHFPDDVFFINKKSSEDKKIITFELVSALEMEQSWVPARQVIANHCAWTYRCSVGCKYKGLPIETLEGKKLTKSLAFDSEAQELDNINIDVMNYGSVDPEKYKGQGDLMNAIPEWDKYGHRYEADSSGSSVGQFVVGSASNQYGYIVGDVVKIINRRSENPYISVPQVFVCIKSHNIAADHHPFIDKKHWLKDECPKTVESCKKRFGNLDEFRDYNAVAGTKSPNQRTHESAGLRFGGFPGAEPYDFI